MWYVIEAVVNNSVTYANSGKLNLLHYTTIIFVTQHAVNVLIIKMMRTAQMTWRPREIEAIRRDSVVKMQTLVKGDNWSNIF